MVKATMIALFHLTVLVGLTVGPIQLQAMQVAGGGESSPFAAASSDASVNFSTGGATVSVPILIPQGRMLTTPSLALTYSHLGGLSSAGMGWSLPLGVISRQTKNGVPRCDSLTMNEFEMVLSGSSNDLVQATTQNPDRFVQKIDEAWSEAIANRNENSWTVRTRAGLTYTFGATPQSRVVSGPNDVFHETGTGCTSFTTAWYVTKVSDTNGNILTIQYEKNGNTPFPRYIYYGGTENSAGTQLINQHLYQVEITPQQITGKPLMRSFSSGADQTLVQRISEVIVRYRTNPSSSFVDEVRRYTLTYDDTLPTQEFLLTAVSATDLPTRTFRYATSTAAVANAQSADLDDPDSLETTRGRGPTMLFMDLNGDGLLDRIKGSSSGSWTAMYGTSDTTLQFGNTTVGQWSAPTSWAGNNNITRDTDGNGQSSDEYTTIDINGDALPDFVARVGSPPRIEVYKGQCSTHFNCGFASTPEYWNNPGTSNNEELRHSIVHSSDHDSTSTTRQLIDMNGDGRPDIVRANSNGDWRIYLNTGSGFQVTPIIYPNVSNEITYSRPAEQNGSPEVAMIDVNSDGLPDRVAMPSLIVSPNPPPPNQGNERYPRDYFVVNSAGVPDGPYSIGVAGPLCANSSYGVAICSGASIPVGSVIVPAVSVQLNTGRGFAVPIFSAAPFYKYGGDDTNRLRSMRSDNGGKDGRTNRDFIDVNGDGRVDWVVTGDEYGGNTPDPDWYVLFNLGDGRFGGPLTVISGRTVTGGNILAFLGEVRPTTVLPDIDPYLGQTFALTNPSDQVNTNITVMDIDGDGIVERVKSQGIGGSLKWDLKKLKFDKDRQGNSIPHTKPMLLVGLEDGVGGRTEFQYGPAARFAARAGSESSNVAGGVPFAQWVVTGIRRTDGLCNTPATDWFTVGGNQCLAQGYELVQAFDYRGAKYDGDSREFRGFREVSIFDAPRPQGGGKRILYFQDAFRKGKTQREDLLIGESIVLGRTFYDWQTVTDGPRTQIYVRDQTIWEYEGFTGSAPATSSVSQCVVHRSSIINGSTPDPMTRVHTSCSMPCSVTGTPSGNWSAGNPSDLCNIAAPGKKQIDMTYVAPTGPFSVWDRPSRMISTYTSPVSPYGVTKTSETEFYYDGLSIGQANRGRLTLERKKISDSPEAWSDKYTTYDAGAAEGPGNITSVRIPRSATDNRDNHEMVFDTNFQFFPVLERLPRTYPNGTATTHEINRQFDSRSGKMTVQTGLVGDVSGATYDSLGRETCRYEPGSTCNGSGFVGVAHTYYHYGDPNASSFADRMSWVEVWHREPNAPNQQYLVTRTYIDALGRDRFTTNEQLNSATNAIQLVMARQIAYGPNGKATQLFEPYWTNGPPAGLSAPVGTAFETTSYVLNGNSTGYLDPAGRVHSVLQFNGAQPKTFYLGNAVVAVAPDGQRTTTSTIDAHGRVVQRVSTGTGGYFDQANVEYDGADNVIREWFGNNLLTAVTKSYDLLSRMVQRVDPDSGTWTRQYDWAGNVVFDNDPKTNQSVQSCYDQQDRVLLQCGQSTDTYDPGFCAIASPTCTRKYVYKYDETALGKGRLTTAINTNTSIKYIYDVRGRVTSRQDIYLGSTKTTSFAYRSDIDRLTNMTYPDGEIVKYGYDAAGNPKTLSRVSSSDQWLEYYVADVKYNIHGKPTFIQHGNNTVDTMTYYGPTENFRLASAKSERPSGGGTDPGEVFLNLSYDDYDANGRLVSISDAKFGSGPLSMSGTYQYDAGGRLTGAAITGQGPESFTYNSIGNMTAKNGLSFGFSQATKPHQATTLGPSGGSSWSMTYNDNGQRITKNNGGVNQTYAYDAFGNLIELTVNGTTTYYGYDHTGQRVFETPTNGGRFFYGKYSEALSSSQLLVKYYYLGDEAVATKADSAPHLFGGESAPITPLVIPPEIYWSVMSAAMVLLFLPLSARRRRWTAGAAPSAASGAVLILLSVGLPLGFGTGCMGDAPTRHLHVGQLGGPLAISKVGGDVDRQYRYSAYGEVRRYDKNGVEIAFDNENRREYGGYETDAASGLQYAGLRFYDPTLATFTSHDPVEQVSNPYAYVGWDPINRIDPSGGLAGEVVALIVFAVLAITMAIAQAVYSAVLSGSAGTFFGSLALSLSGVGTVMGIVRQPATIGFSIPIVGGIAAGVYGVATAQTTADAIFAGVGLGIAIASAALAIYAASADTTSTTTTASRESTQSAGGVGSPAENMKTATRTVILDLKSGKFKISYAGQALDAADIQGGFDAIEFEYVDGLKDASGNELAGHTTFSSYERADGSKFITSVKIQISRSGAITLGEAYTTTGHELSHLLNSVDQLSSDPPGPNSPQEKAAELVGTRTRRHYGFP